MKTIKFRADLVDSILDGSKKSTWRLFDDKNLSVGDNIELRTFGDKKLFATGKITDVVEKKSSQLEEVDMVGHESYSSDEEMYETFSKYYSTKVSQDTYLKIVYFKVLQKIQ